MDTDSDNESDDSDDFETDFTAYLDENTQSDSEDNGRNESLRSLLNKETTQVLLLSTASRCLRNVRGASVSVFT